MNKAIRFKSKSEMIAEEIKTAIISKLYGIGMRLPTERKLATELRTSQLTISKAIAMLSREGLIDKRHGSGNYVVNSVKSIRISFLIDENKYGINPIWSSIYEKFYISAFCSDINIKINMNIIPENCNRIEPLHVDNSDIIIVAVALNPQRVESICEMGKTVIWLEEYSSELPGFSVYFDNFNAGWMAAEHLYEQGCRKILYLVYKMTADSFSGEYYISRRRLEGLSALARKKGMECHSLSFCYPKGNTIHELRTHIDNANDSFDAVCCFSDDLMPYVIRTVVGAGLKIPEDVAVIGFDGQPFCGSFIPTLSTLSQPIDAIALTALKIVKDYFTGVVVEKSYPLPAQLIVRESSLLNNQSRRLNKNESEKNKTI
ncbi:MAG: hypothetical protein A2X48_01905 [Lentisphaerae bacterium GWF2_49_21]|nr:MAG: hypothetical protein A2X48_01905 [Lentisphaerae bacterium GWF2_49_21]